MLGEKREREGARAVGTLLQVDATYWPPKGIMLSDAKEAARLASMKDQGNHDDGHSTVIDSNQDKPSGEMA